MDLGAEQVRYSANAQEVLGYGDSAPSLGLGTVHPADLPALQAAIARARETHGSYTKTFPSAHLTYDVTSNVKAHLSWSKSFGRPVFTALLPSESFNDTNKELTINNPSLKPQLADNWDATLEYYFEPVGQLSAGWFHKTIKDFQVNGVINGIVPTGPDNGYNGDFGGYTILTSANAGTAYVQGWEFSYSQQFTFLPGLLKGLALSANYTTIDTHGEFGDSNVVIENNNPAGDFDDTRVWYNGIEVTDQVVEVAYDVNPAEDYITGYIRLFKGKLLGRDEISTFTLG